MAVQWRLVPLRDIKIIIEIFEICGAISHKPKTFSTFAMSSKGDGHIDESVWLLSSFGNLVNFQ